MHNCKATKGRAAELLLKDLDGSYEELLECEDCSTELQTLREVLRITTRQVEASAPSEEYWNGYHARLRSKLEDAVAGSDGSHQPRFHSSWHSSWRSSWLRKVLSATIRVPVPVGVAVVFGLAVAIFFAVQGSMKEPQPPTASVIRVPVEVPVIQEKTVTRVVYRHLTRQPSRQPTRQPTQGPNSEAPAQNDVSTLAKSQKLNSTTLTGFKPLDEVKLTVIKGGSPDEK